MIEIRKLKLRPNLKKGNNHHGTNKDHSTSKDSKHCRKSSIIRCARLEVRRERERAKRRTLKSSAKTLLSTLHRYNLVFMKYTLLLTSIQAQSANTISGYQHASRGRAVTAAGVSLAFSFMSFLPSPISFCFHLFSPPHISSPSPPLPFVFLPILLQPRSVRFVAADTQVLAAAAPTHRTTHDMTTGA